MCSEIYQLTEINFFLHGSVFQQTFQMSSFQQCICFKQQHIAEMQRYVGQINDNLKSEQPTNRTAISYNVCSCVAL